MKSKRIKNGLNWQNISSDLKEAREQLEEIEKSIQTKKYLDEAELQLMLEHAYHHINFAWNARRVTTENYANLTEAEFNRWSKFPKEIQMYTFQQKQRKRPHNKQLKPDARKTRAS